jgi:hypothetical protein
VDLPAVFDVVLKPTGVDMCGLLADPPQDEAVFDDAVFDTAFDDGLVLLVLRGWPKIHDFFKWSQNHF